MMLLTGTATLGNASGKECALKICFWGGGDRRETIAVSAAEKALWQEIIPQVNKELVKNGRNGNLQLRPEPATIRGGFLLISSNYEVNASLESIVADLEERYFPEVAGILFS